MAIQRQFNASILLFFEEWHWIQKPLMSRNLINGLSSGYPKCALVWRGRRLQRYGYRPARAKSRRPFQLLQAQVFSQDSPHAS